uniref:Sugar phosphate transporter domain-containing protein n=1 Tax=Davidia involucrata TaxID=16924 RepID=A0A5B7BPF3_DAVIN
MALINALSTLPASPPTKSTKFSCYWPLVYLFLSTGLAISLKYNSVGFYHMAKIVVTTIVSSFNLFWKKVTSQKVLVPTVISIGVVYSEPICNSTSLVLAA